MPALVNLAINIPGNTPQQNQEATIRDLMRRAMVLHEAADMLLSPYTFGIVPIDKDKKFQRIELGKMFAPLLEQMSRELKNVAIDTYIRIGVAERTTNSPETKVQTAQEASGETRKNVDDQSGSGEIASGTDREHYINQAYIEAGRDA